MIVTALSLVVGSSVALAGGDKSKQKADVLFEFDSAELQADASTTLQPIVHAAQRNRDLKVVLTGHTDPIGDANYNVNLSVDRAEAVRDQLVEAGVCKSQIVIGAFGEAGADPGNLEQDRRVTAMLTDKQADEIVKEGLPSQPETTAAVWLTPEAGMTAVSTR